MKNKLNIKSYIGIVYVRKGPKGLLNLNVRATKKRTLKLATYINNEINS